MLDELAEIKNLATTIDQQPSPVKATAQQCATALSALADSLCLEDDAECDKFESWWDDARALMCKHTGQHVWTLDHCGHWGHQFCENCREPKHPELSRKRCSEIDSASEQAYLKSQAEATK